jgi:hypothetical protein
VPDVDLAAEGERFLPLTQELNEVLVHPAWARVRVSCLSSGSKFE